MPLSGATDLASKSQIVSDSSNVTLKEEVEDTYKMKIRCPCGSSLQAETMIQVLLLCLFPSSALIMKINLHMQKYPVYCPD